MTGECIIEIRDAKTGELKTRDHIKNLFVTTGKQSIARALAGNVLNNNGQITYCAVGTGADAPTLTDANLGAELYRKQISVRSAQNNQATFQTFFNQSEAVGTLKEAGLYGGAATGDAGTGTLFSRLNINRTKTANDTLTLTWTITVG